MPGRRQAHQNRTNRDTDTSLRQALDQIPTSDMTVRRSPIFWITLPRSSFSSSKNLWTTNRTFLLAGISQISPKLFINHFFDLQVLTSIFMENSTDAHYILGARIMTLMATASTDDENKVLQFALQELHNKCLPTERPPSSVLIQWLWHKHQDSLQRQTFELRAVQAFFDIP